MSLISFVVFLVIVGLVWWLIDTQIPLPPGMKMVLRVLMVLVIVIWLLKLAGFNGPSFLNFR